MTEREKVIEALRRCRENLGTKSCRKCPYMRGRDGTGTCYPIDAEENGVHLCSQDLFDDALALLREQELEIKGLRKLVEWAVECDFGYDNLGDWWVDRFKSEIEGMSYTEGLIHLAKRYVEVFEGGDGDDDTKM